MGDQSIKNTQNKTLSELASNGVDVHLFEVLDEGEYIFCGHVVLWDKPYQETQKDVNGNDRLVWVFPVRPVPENDVIKMPLFTFKNMDEYRERGEEAEREFERRIKERKKKQKPEEPKKPTQEKKIDDKPIIEEKKVPIVPISILGKAIHHQKFGDGTIVAIINEEFGIIKIMFSDGAEKILQYKTLVDNHLMEVI